jgi:hypothetical protein
VEEMPKKDGVISRAKEVESMPTKDTAIIRGGEMTREESENYIL